MELNGKQVLVCNCEHTMPLDGKRLARACGVQGATTVNSQLCRAQIENFRSAIQKGGELIVACTQEAPLFRETAAEAGTETGVRYLNIRESAGWSAEAADASPKIAALLAEAALDIPAATTVSMTSEGACLVYGRDETAIDAARQLAARLDVTLLLTRPEGMIPPRVTEVPLFKGTITSASGHLGAFEIVVDDYAPVVVSSRQELAFEDARNGATSKCDLILDLTGGQPLFPAPEKRDGYFRPDPGDPVAVQRALFDLTEMVGEFAKPRYVDFNADLCAHSRNAITGCTRCLDICPASAIAPDGDHVHIDPYVCGGCGGCHSVCPTGAASYALPPGLGLIERIRTLLTTYYKAGGKQADLLVHDERHGIEVVTMMARFGRGLPATVLPVAVNEVTQIGFDFLSAAFAYGAGSVFVLVPPARRDELDGLAGQIGLSEAVMSGLGYGSGRVEILTEADPDAVEARLYERHARSGAPRAGFLAMGSRRNVTAMALAELHKAAPKPVETISLARGASYGNVNVDTGGCTLCLACVGTCPTGALIDNPDRPQLSFQETACIQCGLCKATCPESVISLEPRLNFTEQARRPRLLKEEEPFACIRCGKPFGTKSSIERIITTLAGKHAMFMDDRAAEQLKMCEDCRIIAKFEDDSPFKGPERPQTRTSDDYAREPEIEEARRKVLEERARGDGEDGQN